MTTTTPTLLTRSDVTGGVNTHACWSDPNPYHPPAEKAELIASWGLRYIRERWFPRNKAQRTFFETLVDNGVGLYLTIGAMDSSLDAIDADLEALKASPFLESVIGICGPNEPNKSENTTWQDKLYKVQKRIWEQRPADVWVAAGALKVNVKTYEDDWRKLDALGITAMCDILDFHNYPGEKGPRHTTGVAAQLAAAGGKPTFQSETGWTTHDTAKDDQTRWVTEAILRNSLDPNIVGTTIYEAFDYPEAEGPHSGHFGPDWAPTAELLNGIDYGRDFPGWLATWQNGLPYDGTAVCTSDEDGWTLYLLEREGSEQHDFTLVLPAGLGCSLGEPTKVGSDGKNRWVDVPVVETMTTIYVGM